jgi:phage shock protein C
MEKRLYRSRNDRMLAGVCGGLAKYFNLDPVLVRVLAVVAVIISFCAALIAYIILAVVVPLESSVNIPGDNSQGRN